MLLLAVLLIGGAVGLLYLAYAQWQQPGSEEIDPGQTETPTLVVSPAPPTPPAPHPMVWYLSLPGGEAGIRNPPCGKRQLS